MACGREGALRLFIGLALLAPARAAVTTVAGSGEAGTTDGVGTAAKFSYPRSLTLHRTGDETLLVSHDYKIRSVQLETKAVGTWHTLTTKPQGAVFRSNGNTLYVAEVIQDGGTTSHRILAITPAGIGTCPPAGWDRCAPVTWPPPDNGHCCSKWGFLGNSDVHCSPEGLNALDGCCTINSFTGLLSCPAAGSPSVTTVRTVAGADDAGYMDSTVGASVRFNYPSGLAISPDDALLYVTDGAPEDWAGSFASPTHSVREVKIGTGETRTIAGGVTPGDRADYGSTIFPKSSNVPYVGDQARFMRPEDVVISQDGTTLYVSDRFGQYIHRVTIATREVQAIAGTGVAGFKDSTDADTDGLTAQFHHPRGLALSESGTVLYVADDTNHRIREVDLADSGKTSTLAGEGTAGFKDDSNLAAQFNRPFALAVKGRSLYVSDMDNHRIRKVDLPLSSVGDDPVFVGADGREYEVLGEVNSSFNLISSPALSLNAQFIEVPPAFRGAKAGNTSRELTNTTLGSVHLAACAAANRPHAQAQAEGQAEGQPDGRRRASRTPGPLHLRLDAAVSQPLRCSYGNARGEGPFCANAAAAVGMRLTEERYACMLSTVSCGYYPAGLSAGAIPIPPDMRAALSDPSLIQIDMARFNITFGGLRLSIVRDAVWGPLADLNAHQVDCTRLRPWSRAVEACELLVAALRGDVSGWLALDPSVRVATATALSRGKPENVFHYTNVRVEGASVPQADVHGLLGQRAIEPRDHPHPHPRPAALGAEVSSNGEVSFGKQGEGAIEGSWEEYRVPRLEAHDGAFRYARFGCERGR